MTVISLTTIPERGARIEPVLDSLIAQGYPVYLWVPKKLTRTGATWQQIPKFFDKVHWEFVDDMGPATKLLPALWQFDTVITADDDTAYGPGWAKGLVEWSEKLPNAAVAYRGRIIKQGQPYRKSKLVQDTKRPREVNFITGVRGALYRREFFDGSICTEWRQCPTADDVAFSAHLRKRGVPVMIVPRKCTIRKLAHWQTKPVHHVNQRGPNDRALEEVFWCSTPK